MGEPNAVLCLAAHDLCCIYLALSIIVTSNYILEIGQMRIGLVHEGFRTIIYPAPTPWITTRPWLQQSLLNPPGRLCVIFLNVLVTLVYIKIVLKW